MKVRCSFFVLGLAILLSSCAAVRSMASTPAHEDPYSHLRQALQFYEAESFPEAADAFLRAAALSDSLDLRLRYLGAAALCWLKTGDRTRFLEIEARLESALPDSERLLPPREIADIIGLGRVMRGERLPRGVSPSMQRLINDLINNGGVK